MNFKAQITNIQQNNGLACLCCQSDFGELKFFTLQLPNKVNVGVSVILGFKSFDLLLSKQPCKLLCANEFLVKIQEIKTKEFISQISLQCQNNILEAIISSDESKNLRVFDEIYAYLSYYSLYIDEILC